MRAKGEFEVDPYEGNKSIYSGMKLEKIDAPDFKGIILDSSSYEDKISHIEIPTLGVKKKMIS